MPTVIEIGYNHYLVKSEAQALALFKALSGAVRIDKHYNRNGEYYVPQEKPVEVSMTSIRQEKIKRRKEPDPDEEAIEVESQPKQLNTGFKLLGPGGK